jgi:hypothetical protein
MDQICVLLVARFVSSIVQSTRFDEEINRWCAPENDLGRPLASVENFSEFALPPPNAVSSTPCFAALSASFSISSG